MICSVDGCNRKHSAHGMCTTHLTRLQRHGSVDGKKERAIKCCTVDGCERKHYGGGLCRYHYNELRRRGTVDTHYVDDLPGEEWAEIEGRKGVMVSTLGRVKSIRKRNERLMSSRFQLNKTTGVKSLVVSDSFTGSDIIVHMEVLRAFHHNVHGDSNAYFRDGNRANCQLDNLAWYGYDILIDKAIALAEQSSSRWADCLLKFWHGDNEALDEFWGEMRNRLQQGIPRRLDRLGLSNWYIDIDDVVQETLVQAFFSIKRGMITTIDNITGWIFSIAKNLTHRWMDYSKKLNPLMLDSDDGGEYSIADAVGFCYPSAELQAIFNEECAA